MAAAASAEVITGTTSNSTRSCHSAIHDLIPKHALEVTADWSYLRFHGRHYHGSYTPEQLRRVVESVK